MTTFTREQGWAAVLTFWQASKLPTPDSINASHGSIDVNLASYADLQAWSTALSNVEVHCDRSLVNADTMLITWHAGKLDGIRVSIRSHEHPSVLASITAELDGALSAVVAGLTAPVKTEFAACRYIVGGLGGDVELHVDEQPAGLTRVWDLSEAEWREFAIDATSTYWTPTRPDGTPEPDCARIGWAELLEEFGPVSSVMPAYDPLDAAVPA